MKGSKEKIIYFITGASGVGKTTLVSELETKYRNMPWAFLHFDSIGVPSVSEMQKAFGSPSGWQESKAHEWIDRLIHNYTDEKIFLEGQVNLEFIRNGFQKHNFNSYKIILIDCSEAEMAHRLISKRAQPELFSNDMRNWLKFLRSQAEISGTVVIDTSDLSRDEALQKFEEAIWL